MIGEYLYKLDPADQPLLEQWHAGRTVSTAAVSPNTIIDVPSDAHVLLTHMCMRLAPDPGAIALRLTWNFVNNLTFVGPNNPILWELDFERPRPAAGAIVGATLACRIWLPRGSQLTIFGVFSAAAGPNAIFVDAYGVKIPRGNFRPVNA